MMKIQKVDYSINAREEDLRLSARYRSRLYRRFKRWKITNSAIAKNMSAEDLETMRQEMKREMSDERALEQFRIDNQFKSNAPALAGVNE